MLHVLSSALATHSLKWASLSKCNLINVRYGDAAEHGDNGPKIVPTASPLQPVKALIEILKQQLVEFGHKVSSL